jgi:hypothetical protein
MVLELMIRKVEAEESDATWLKKEMMPITKK